MIKLGEQIEFLNFLEQNPFKLYKVKFYDEALKQNMTYLGFKGMPAKNPIGYEGKQIIMAHVSNPDDSEFLTRRIYELKDDYFKHTLSEGKEIDWDNINQYEHNTLQ